MEDRKQLRSHRDELQKAHLTTVRAETFLTSFKASTTQTHTLRDALKGVNYARRCLEIVVRNIQNYLLDMEIEKGGEIEHGESPSPG